MRSTAMTAGSGRTSVAASDVPIGSTGASTTVTSGEIARTDTILRVAVVVVIGEAEAEELEYEAVGDWRPLKLAGEA